MGKVKAESFKCKWNSQYGPSAFGTWPSCILAMPYPRRYFIILRCNVLWLQCRVIFSLGSEGMRRESCVGLFQSMILFQLFATSINDKICRRCHWYRWCTLTCEYLRGFMKKFEMALMLFSGACEKIIYEKNLNQKISWHCPFNSSGVQTYQAAQFGKELAYFWHRNDT